MYINHSASYLPEGILTNEELTKLNGLTSEWIIERTGIEERRVAAPDENNDTIGMQAIKNSLKDLPYNVKEVDLIVAATYTPYDTVATLAHKVQHELDIPDIPAVYVSAACSSFLNAVEIVQGYFALNKATKALVLVTEHNSFYNDTSNPQYGHLWGDGAAVVYFSKERTNDADLKVVDIYTKGAATVGKSISGVNLVPHKGKDGILMENGRDVFQNACEYMTKSTLEILERNNYKVEELSLFIPHQANLRITKNVAQQLNLPMEKAVSNLVKYGNTGCAGCAIGLAENMRKLKKGEFGVVSVFGGGYSYGAMLFEA